VIFTSRRAFGSRRDNINVTVNLPPTVNGTLSQAASAQINQQIELGLKQALAGR